MSACSALGDLIADPAHLVNRKPRGVGNVPCLDDPLRTYAGRSYVAHVEPGVWPAGVPLDQEVVMGYMVSRDDGWRMPDWLWEQVEPLLPAPPSHPLGCHNPRVANRDAMDAILMVLRTGMQWNALDASGICSSSSAHRRFQEWERAGIPIERPKPTRERPQGLC